MAEAFINKSLLKGTHADELRISKVNQFQKSMSFAPLSLKYVVKGTEHYKVGKKHIELQSGDYLFGNHSVQSDIIIDHPHSVQGICIDLSRETLHQVLDYHFQEAHSFKEFIDWSDERVTHKRGNSSHTATFFQQLTKNYDKLLQEDMLLQDELFFHLSQCWLQDRLQDHTHFQRLKVAKPDTQRRLFVFLNEVKAYIDTHFYEDLSIRQLASEAALSEYHFLRLFKQVFGLSPYQLLLQQRLAAALPLLQSGLKVEETALTVGFSDVSTFRKAFKKVYERSPSQWIVK